MMKKFTKPTVILSASLLILGFGWLICAILQLRLNTSASMPIGIYRVIEKPVTRGSWVEVCLPIDIAKVGLSRNYLTGGQCVGGSEPVVKLVVGIQGDDIDVQKSGVSVNGKLLPHSQTFDQDSQGRPLEHIPRGHYRLQENELWLYGNNNVRSWDSRYFGVINDLYVISALTPVFIFHQEGK